MIGTRRIEQEIDVAAELAGHRGAMGYSAMRRRAPGLRPFMMLVVLVAAAIGCSVVWAARHRIDPAPIADKQDEVLGNTLPPLTPYVPAPAPTVQQTSTLAPAALAMISPDDKAADLAMQRRLGGGFRGGEGGSASTGVAGMPAGAIESVDKDPLTSQLSPLNLKSSKATTLSDRNYLLTRGAMIDCGQQTMLVTDQPGMVTCYTTSDTYSSNGHVVLVDAGSKIVGSYEHGVMQGQDRVFVTWQRIETPKGVIIDLDSPGTDPLGAAGEPGQVDTHFWARFGGAIMLSLISDAGDAGVQEVANHSNSSITLNNTTGTANEMAAEALRNTINIPPTLYKNAGDRVSIYVARDLDFSGVYDLKPE